MIIGQGLDGRPKIQINIKKDTVKKIHKSRNRWDLNTPFLYYETAGSS